MDKEQLFTIDCGDILLREFCIDDVDAIQQLTSEPEVYRFLPDWRSTREQRLDWVTNYEVPDNKQFLAAVPEVGQHILKLGIILKETGEFIGFCNTGIKEELPEPNREVAYAMSTKFCNNGYTSQAVKGLVNYLFTNTEVTQMNAVVLQNNGASKRVIEKCGFQWIGEVIIEGQVYDHYMFYKFPEK
ncbi:GNAT family N-acetyltransferase [Sporosarcina sp. Te-1]|uniref:GNAT family N-acetyltransferase n=1 Tax=Sporosarcina sp. Te-1 TaxID=2818390 RepID=UPI001A9E1984|nr:GNAT family N-acetyltransferase [Sporosarcina sp. Te-1]QTD41804.1 GNAT family N-acetyltransferase [Sporosarcina sp. Te-1]